LDQRGLSLERLVWSDRLVAAVGLALVNKSKHNEIT